MTENLWLLAKGLMENVELQVVSVFIQPFFRGDSCGVFHSWPI